MEPAHEFDFEICNSRMRPLADELIKKYEELRHLDASKILFVVNHKSAGSKKTLVLARTSGEVFRRPVDNALQKREGRLGRNFLAHEVSGVENEAVDAVFDQLLETLVVHRKWVGSERVGVALDHQ